MGLLIQRKIGKIGKTRSKKEKKRKKTGNRKIFFKWERVSFRSCSNKFWPAHISSRRLICGLLKIFNVCSTIHQTPMYRLLESVFGAKAAEVRQSMANVTLSLCSSQFWPLSTLVHLESCSESEFDTMD